MLYLVGELTDPWALCSNLALSFTGTVDPLLSSAFLYR